MAHKIILIVLLLSGSQLTAIAQGTQTDHSATIYPALPARKYKITLGDNRQLVARSLDSLKGNTLYISGIKGPQQVSVELIQSLKVAKKRRPVARGLLFGAVAGVTSGALFGYATYRKPDPNSWGLDFGPGFNAMFGGFGGFLIGSLTGTIIGASSNRYTHYDFSQIPPAEKSAFMGRILSGQ